MKRVFSVMILLGPLFCHYAVAGPSAEDAIEQAKALQQKADSLQGGWITTDELIAKAEAALAQGNHEKALALASRAKREAELAYQQAEDQRRNWSPPPYVSQ